VSRVPDARRFIATNDGGSADGLGELMPDLVHAAKAAAILDTLNADVIHDHTAACTASKLVALCLT
jgi:hypothetical protein